MNEPTQCRLVESRSQCRWFLLIAVALLLLGLTATVAWASTNETSFPDWLEPRGLSIVELAGEVPDSILEDMMISYGDGTGIVVYESSAREGDTLVLTTTIHSRLSTPWWAPNGKITIFGCLGQIPHYDHMGTVVPASTLRVYDSKGAEVTSQIEYLTITYMNAQKPLANSRQYERYPKTVYGPEGSQPLPLGPDGLEIPPNSGCSIEIYGQDYYPLKGVFTINAPRSVKVSVLGKQELKFHTYIGPGSVGIFSPLMRQMKANYPNRHEHISLTIPADTGHFLLKLLPQPGDPFMDQKSGPPYPNADRPTGGTYRLARDLDTLGTDLIFSAAFPVQVAWRDADQAPGSTTLPELISPSYLAVPEYVIPFTLPYDPCYTQGNCPGSLLHKIYTAEMIMDLYYLDVNRRLDTGAWVPVKMAGPGWSALATGSYRDIDTLTSEPSPGPSTSSDATPDDNIGYHSPVMSTVAINNEGPADATSGQGVVQKSFAVKPSPILDFDKEATPDTDVGHHAPVTYTVTLTNKNDRAADDVILYDRLPEETTFADWVQKPTGATIVDHTVTWTGTIPADDSVTFVFVVSQTAYFGTTVTNTAQFTHATGTGRADATFTVEPAPQLSISKTATPQNAGYYEPVVYTVIVSNTGSTDAAKVMVTDILPAETSFSHWVEQPHGATVANDEVTWTGTISADSAMTLGFVVNQQGEQGTTVINSATYSHSTMEGTAEASFTIETNARWWAYLPFALRSDGEPAEPETPEPPQPPPEPLPDGCPCGWFDPMGRMLDFAPGN